MLKNVLIRHCRENIFLILIFIISILFLIPLFTVDYLAGHDNLAQLVRIAAHFKALMDGQFPPRWVADLNYGYGHPGFIFFYSLPGYFGALLHLLGLTFEFGNKVLLAVTFVLAPIFFFLWTEQFLKKKNAFISSLLYGLAPYSFLDLYVRGNLGECLAIAIIPLVFYFIERNLKKITTTNIILGGIAYMLLILSHNILSLVFSFIFICYILFKGFKNNQAVLANFYIIVIGLILSAYFWIPAFFEAHYINSKIFVAAWYKNHFLNIPNFIYSAWGFGSDVNKPGGLSPQIGPLHFIYVLLSILFIFKIKQTKIVFFWVIIFITGIIMSTSLSTFLWERLHILQQFQFPWRFLFASVFSASILAGFILENFKSKYLLFFTLIFLIVLSIPMAQVIGIKNRGDSFYLNYPGTGTYHNEATTIWVDGDAYKYPKEKIEIIGGKAKIVNYVRKSNVHSFILIADSKSQILDNTVYFPGWRVEVDGKKVPIEFQDNNHRGLITFYVDKGIHDVKVIFGETPIRLLSDLISLFGIIFVVGYFFNRIVKLIKIKI